MLYQLVSLRQVFLRFNKLTRIEEEIGNLNVCFNFILEISYLALLDSFSSMLYLNVIESKLFSQRCHDVEKYLKCERVKLLEAPVLLTLSRRRSLSYRNQSINLLSILAGFYMIRTSITKELNGEMEFFLYDISVWILLNDFQGRIENTFKHLRWSVIRQKGKSQKERFKKTKHDKFSEKQTPDTHTYVCVSRGKKCSFFWKCVVLCFLETSVLRFALLPNYRRDGASFFLHLRYLTRLWIRFTEWKTWGERESMEIDANFS